MPRLCPRCKKHFPFDQGERCASCGGPLFEITDPDVVVRPTAALDRAEDPFNLPTTASAQSEADTLTDQRAPAPVSGLRTQPIPARTPAPPSTDDDDGLRSRAGSRADRGTARGPDSLPPLDNPYYHVDTGVERAPAAAPPARAFPGTLPPGARRCPRCGIVSPSSESSCVRCGAVFTAGQEPLPVPGVRPAAAHEPSGLELAAPARAIAPVSPWLQEPAPPGSAGSFPRLHARWSALQVLVDAALATVRSAVPLGLLLLIQLAVLGLAVGAATLLARIVLVLSQGAGIALLVVIGLGLSLVVASFTSGMLLVLHDRLRPEGLPDFPTGFVEALGQGREAALRVVLVWLVEAAVVALPVLLVAGLAHLAGLGPQGAGVALTIALAPAAWLSLRLVLALPITVLERAPAQLAILESFDRTAGRLWRIAAVLLLYLAASALVLGPLSLLRQAPLLASVLGGLASAGLGCLYLALGVRLWLHLSSRD